MFLRSSLLLALATSSLGLGSCCGPSIGKQVREEMAVTRGSEVHMGGLITMTAFTDPDAVEKLVAGSSEQKIVEVVGPPWRKLPAREGELWVWDYEVFRELFLLAINVVDGHQRGDAVTELHTIPDFMLHHDLLKPGIEVSKVVDYLGSPTRWEIVGGQCTMIWEATMQLEKEGVSSWRYAPDIYLHSLHLEAVGDYLQSVSPIVSSKLDGLPSSTAQAAAADARQAWRSWAAARQRR